MASIVAAAAAAADKDATCGLVAKLRGTSSEASGLHPHSNPNTEGNLRTRVGRAAVVTSAGDCGRVGGGRVHPWEGARKYKTTGDQSAEGPGLVSGCGEGRSLTDHRQKLRVWAGEIRLRPIAIRKLGLRLHSPETLPAVQTTPCDRWSVEAQDHSRLYRDSLCPSCG